jgi:hypothetical protein
MAKVFDGRPDVPKHTGYPWDEWQDGRWWEIVKGVDFHHDTTKKMLDQLFVRAKATDRKVTTRVREESIFFRFQGPDESVADFLKAKKLGVNTSSTQNLRGTPVQEPPR